MSKKEQKSAFKNPFELDDIESHEMINLKEQIVEISNQVVQPQSIKSSERKIDNQSQRKTYSYKQELKDPINDNITGFNPFANTSGDVIDMSDKYKQYASYNSQQISNDELETGVLNQKQPGIEFQQMNQNDDPPLLEDIGIDIPKIKSRILTVIKVKDPTADMIEDPDLAGPILIMLCFGFLLALSGKLHFGDIYAIFIVGNILIFFLINFMSQTQYLPLYNVVSTTGYGLIPMLLLGAVRMLTVPTAGVGVLISLGFAAWSSYAAGNIMAVLMMQPGQIPAENNRKLLITYPLFLFYVMFAIIALF